MMVILQRIYKLNQAFQVVPALVFLLFSSVLFSLAINIAPVESKLQSSVEIVQANPEPTYEPTSHELCQPSNNMNIPYLISITQVGIENACIEPVGVEADGALGDPENLMMAGWYVQSSNPKSPGAGIYTCHTSFNPEKEALCSSLNELAIGDEIIVEISSGEKITYQVQNIITVPLSEVDMDEFQRTFHDADYGINLMTCGGAWDEKTDDATHRLLIWATRD